jgi:hypothetical protein
MRVWFLEFGGKQSACNGKADKTRTGPFVFDGNVNEVSIDEAARIIKILFILSICDVSTLQIE